MAGQTMTYAELKSNIASYLNRSDLTDVIDSFIDSTEAATGGLLSGVIVEATSYHALSHWAAVLALSLVAAALYPVVTKTKPQTTTAA